MSVDIPQSFAADFAKEREVVRSGHAIDSIAAVNLLLRKFEQQNAKQLKYDTAFRQMQSTIQRLEENNLKLQTSNAVLLGKIQALNQRVEKASKVVQDMIKTNPPSITNATPAKENNEAK